MDEPAKHYPTREEIDKADDRPYEDVPAPELGEGACVRVRMMSAAERDSWEQAHNAAEGENVTAILLVHVLVHPESGKPLYAVTEAAELGAKGHLWQTRAAHVALRLNGVARDSVEQLAKN